MPAAYSLDLRQKINNAYQNKKGSMRTIANQFGVSFGTVKNYIQRFRETKTLNPSPPGGGNSPKVKRIHEPFLRTLIKKEPDLTLEELSQRFESEFLISVSVSAMDRALRRFEMTRKKKRFMIQRKKVNELKS